MATALFTGFLGGIVALAVRKLLSGKSAPKVDKR